jgi:hypothetical protein
VVEHDYHIPQFIQLQPFFVNLVGIRAELSRAARNFVDQFQSIHWCLLATEERGSL